MHSLMILAVLLSTGQASTGEASTHRAATPARAKTAPAGLSGEAMLRRGAHGVIGGPSSKPSGIGGADVRRRR